MLIERIWRKRLILSFIILIVWGMNIVALLTFGSTNPEQLTGIRLVVGSILLIVLYYFSINRIMRFDWTTINKRQFSILRYILWLFYPLFAFNLYIVSLLLRVGSDFFLSKTMVIISRIGDFGLMFLVIAMLVIFHRWHMAFRTIEHTQSISMKLENS